MRPSVTLEAAHTQRRSLVVWSAALAALIALYIAVWPSVEGSGSSFSKLIDDMPAAYKALFTNGGGVDFSTPAGYLNVELFSFMAPIVVLVYAIGTGASAIAGEEDRRTIDLLLVNTVSRGRVVIEKMAALIFGVAVLSSAMWLSLVIEGRVAGMDVPTADAAATVVHLGLLGIEFGALALFIGAATGRVGMSRAVPAAIAAGTYVINALGTMVGWLEPIRRFSPFFQYNGHDPMHTGLAPTAVAVSITSIVLLVAGAVWMFRRRDVGT
ncbi:MAG TPA: ABC transporter permease subunit [Acidimicrobiales bacterium]|nr:ABC transporter permease subunit [Acidimicrobiales bacterium]